MVAMMSVFASQYVVVSNLIAGAAMICKNYCPLWVVRFIFRVTPHIFETQVGWARLIEGGYGLPFLIQDDSHVSVVCPGFGVLRHR